MDMDKDRAKMEAEAAAAEAEAIKAAAAAAAHEEELRKESRRAEIEARRQAEEDQIRRERERARGVVLGAFMTHGTQDQAQKLLVELGLAVDGTLIEWMEPREYEGKISQRTRYFFAEKRKVEEAIAAATNREYLRSRAGLWKFCVPTRRAPGGSTTTASTQPRATARASAPAWIGPQPKLYQWDTPTDQTGVSGRTWVGGTSYAKVARAGVVNPDQAAQFQEWLALVDQKYDEKFDRLEQLLAKKAQSDEEETKKDKRLVDAEKAILTIAAELQEANMTIRAQGQQIDELKKVAAKAKTDHMILQLHLEEKNKLNDQLLLEREIWRRQSHEEWKKETPPRPPASGPGFDFSPAAMMESPNTPSIPASPRPVEQVAHKTPTKRLDMSGAGAMASPLQGTDGHPPATAAVPEPATPAPPTPAPSEPEISAPRSTSPPWQQVGRPTGPEKAEADLSVAEVIAIRERWCKGEQWPTHYKGPRPAAPKVQPQRQTKEENLAMRAARLEGQSLESLAVALQGKRPPPTPSPASKATLAQEGPSKAPAIEDDSSETAKSAPGGDANQ